MQRRVNMLRAITTLSIIAIALSASAQTGDDVEVMDDEFALLQELMQILAEETTVATKTKLNSDYVPGMVTVLQGEDLEAMGITTAWEALSVCRACRSFEPTLASRLPWSAASRFRSTRATHGRPRRALRYRAHISDGRPRFTI